MYFYYIFLGGFLYYIWSLTIYKVYSYIMKFNILCLKGKFIHIFRLFFIFLVKAAPEFNLDAKLVSQIVNLIREKAEVFNANIEKFDVDDFTDAVVSYTLLKFG